MFCVHLDWWQVHLSARHSCVMLVSCADKDLNLELKLPAAPLKRDLRFAPTSCRESSKCKEEISFYCSSLAHPAAPKAGPHLRYDKLWGMLSL
jgi:hypothetical protein